MNIDSDGTLDHQVLPPTTAATRRLMPMRIGQATVYIEQVGVPAEVEQPDGIYTVAPSPQEAFEKAGEVLQACVRIVGEQIDRLEDWMPHEVTVEFSLSFEGTGRASIIPVFVTAETKATTGLKVTAKWQRNDGIATESLGAAEEQP